MPFRHYRTPADILSHEGKVQAIEAVSKEVDQKIDTIAQSSDIRTAEEAIEATITNARKLQLGTLSHYVFEIAMNGLHGASLDLDDPQFVEDADLFYSGGFPLGTDHVMEAAKKGGEKGTHDLLEILVPREFTDEVAREQYFLPWTRQALQKYRGFKGGMNGRATAFFPTRIPGVGVTYIYEDNDRFPRRTIGPTKE